MARFSILLLAIMLFACKKPDHADPQPSPTPPPPSPAATMSNTFKGYVLDYETGAPIPGATVMISHFAYNTTYLSIAPPHPFPITGHYAPSMYKEQLQLYSAPQMDVLTTNSAGYYELDWNPYDTTFTKYLIGAYKSGYTHPFRLKALKSMSGNNTDTFYLDQNTYVKFILNNVSPAFATDSLEVGEFYRAPDGSYGIYAKRGSASPFSPTMGMDYFNGVISNATFTDTISGKSFISGTMVIKLRSGGVQTTTNQTFPIVPRTTNVVNVNY